MAEALPSIKLPAPLIISNNQIENWKIFKQSWDNYSIIAKLHTQDEAFKKALFLHCIGTDALRAYNTLTFLPEEDKLSDIVSKFESLLIGKVNETYERFKFNQRLQKEGEPFDSFLTDIKSLAKTCNFENLHDSLLRDRLVIGIRSLNARKRLLQERSLDLAKCIDICRAAETSEIQLKAIDADDRINRIQDKDRYIPKKFSRDSRNPETKQSLKKCKFCARSHIFRKELCPAWGKTCQACKGKNHFAICCPQSAKAHMLQEDDLPSDDEHFLLTLHSDKKKAIFIRLTMNNQPVQFQVDSGATANVIPSALLLPTDITSIEKTKSTLKTYNNDIIRCQGKIKKTLVNPLTDRSHSTEFLVVEDPNATPILGKVSSEEIGVLSVDYCSFEHVNSLQATENLIQTYSDVFDKPVGCLPKETNLTLKPGSTPVNCKAARLPIALHEKVKNELSRLENIGVISKTEAPTEWCSRMVVATKSSGDLRICIDPKALNENLEDVRFQLPIMDEILPKLTKARVFTKLDVKSAFWHCKLDEQSSLLTTFATPFGAYKWNRLPFGLCISSEIFQRSLSESLDSLPGVLFAMDDIIVTGCGLSDEEAIKDHNENLSKLLERCRTKNISLNKKKLDLCKSEITFLGHKVTSAGLQPDPEKVAAVANMTPPHDVKGVERMVGFINYLAKFLPKLSEEMHPIRQLLSNQTNFRWGEAQENAFSNIKKLVIQAPVLAYYDQAKELTIQCDASNNGLGAAILQEGKPVAFASRALTDTERRYATIEKETLAIIFALQKFHQYTFGRKVLIHSDHKPLESIIKKDISAMPRRLQGMMMKIQQYNVRIAHKSGKDMHIADTLSRASLPSKQGQEEFEQINYANEIAVRTERLERIKTETEKDPALSRLKDCIINGWPQHSVLPSILLPFYNFKDDL